MRGRELQQLIGETREPLPVRPGAVERYNSIYVRNGTANLVLLASLWPDGAMLR